MAVIGVDDTDSRERGMCTTYLAASLASRLREEAQVSRPVLVRLNPAVPHKTRGNAAVALVADVPVERAFAVASELVEDAAETADEDTHPGLVVASGDPRDLPDDVAGFYRNATRELLDVEDALALVDAHGFRAAGWKTGRGRIGALAAVGATRGLDDPTYELIAYRQPRRWGTPRSVDADSVFAAAEWGYPTVWDSVDRTEREAVCVPNTPGPVLYGVRGDDPGAVRSVASRIGSEPVDAAALFVTNQGTDAHVREGAIGDLRDDRAYRVEGVVAGEPRTERGGHVFVRLEPVDVASDGGGDHPPLRCAAFEPTKRFRDRVRALRPGDRITACGEVTDGTLKLEKFAVRDLVEAERVTPTCPDCDRRMESAGADQGYRCRDCGTAAEGKVERRVERDLEVGWYEVPPVARRHVAKPLVRGGFDGPVHPER